MNHRTPGTSTHVSLGSVVLFLASFSFLFTASGVVAYLLGYPRDVPGTLFAISINLGLAALIGHFMGRAGES